MTADTDTQHGNGNAGPGREAGRARRRRNNKKSHPSKSNSAAGNGAHVDPGSGSGSGNAKGGGNANGGNRQPQPPQQKTAKTTSSTYKDLNGGGNGGDKSGSGGGRNRPSPLQQRSGRGGDAPTGPKQKRAERKQGKRARQLEAMEKKARAEDDYFRTCQKEAAAAAKSQRREPTAAQQKTREAALFGKQGAQGINFGKYDKIQVDVRPGVNVQGCKKAAGADVAAAAFSDFDELALPQQLRKNIRSMNYAKATPIQRHAVPLGLAGHDLMCCAQTGSGKTAAFLLPVCAALAARGASGPDKMADEAASTYQPVEAQCVVLAPTRELASQIELEAEKLCFNMPDLQPVAVYGGASQRGQLRQLAFAANAGSAIIVATPGRLTDFVDRNLISLHSVRYLILDEADRMLDMGFEPQIRKLVLRSNMSPKTKRQTFMFSATFPDKIQLLAGEFLRQSYTWIAVGRVGSTTDNITQVLKEVTADKRHKLKLVVEAVQGGPAGRTLVFVQKKRDASWLRKQLSKGGPEGWEHCFEPIDSTEIHGDRSQPQREAALAKFRSGECRILVATDVAARGLDIGGVEHVINMDLPIALDDFDSYVHRIGRTGRAGHTGLATSLYVRGDAPRVGNRKIAVKLIQQLKEAKQQVPAFLEAECANGGGSGRNKQCFGGNDVRRSSSGGRR